MVSALVSGTRACNRQKQFILWPSFSVHPPGRCTQVVGWPEVEQPLALLSVIMTDGGQQDARPARADAVDGPAMRHVVGDHPHEHRGLSFGLSCPRLLASATVRAVASRAWTKTCGPARTSVCKFGKRALCWQPMHS